MKIVIAPDSYKGNLSALQLGKAIREGIFKLDAGIEIILVPMADGGEGTVQSLIDATGGKIIDMLVHDPLFRKINSFYGILGDGKTAVIEMAAASGLPLVKSRERNPLKTTSYGTGELINDALDKGCTEIILGLGGSATNDGGAGMAQALGVRFLDRNGNDVPLGGGELLNIQSIDSSGIDPRITNTVFKAACDVDNPLCGINGASHVYGKQKGADTDDISALDSGLAHFAHIINSELGKDIKNVPGAGAAGGLGYGAMVFLNASLESGIGLVTSAAKLTEKMENADLVITGEGKLDFQTAFGKTPFGVAQLAREKGIPVVAIVGSLGKDYQSLYEKGFAGIFSIIDKPMSLDEAIENTEELLKNASESLIRFWISAKH